MKKCNNCGAQNADSSLFCTKCGKPIPEGKVCPNCGAPVNDGDVFCTECGNKISENVSSQPTVSAQEVNTESDPPTVYYDEEDEGKHYLKYILGTVAVIAVVVIITMHSYWSGTPSGSDTDTLAVDSAVVDSAFVDSGFDPDSAAAPLDSAGIDISNSTSNDYYDAYGSAYSQEPEYREFKAEEYVYAYIANQSFYDSGGATISFDGECHMYIDDTLVSNTVSVLSWNSRSATIQYRSPRLGDGKLVVRIVSDDAVEIYDPVDGITYNQR